MLWFVLLFSTCLGDFAEVVFVGRTNCFVILFRVGALCGLYYFDW